MSFDVQSVPDLSIMIDRCNCAENYTSGMESLNVHTVLKPTENCIFFNKRVLFSPICQSKKCGINNEKIMKNENFSITVRPTKCTLKSFMFV